MSEDAARQGTTTYEWFHRAASGGNPYAQFNLAQLYLRGDGVARDEAKAAAWLARAAQQGLADPALGEGAQLFATIEGNYADSVRLLATARSARFDGEALMFVARRTLPAGMDVKATWAPWITRLQAHEVDCAHVDIIAPAQLAQIGPVLNRALKAL